MDSDSDFSKNKYLRKSIYYAIDKEKMLKYLRNNVGIPANHGFFLLVFHHFLRKTLMVHYNLNA